MQRRMSIVGWFYDQETDRIVGEFVDAPSLDDPDPANYISTLSLKVELLPRIVDDQPIAQPEEAKLNQLNEVVDQLILDILMGGM